MRDLWDRLFGSGLGLLATGLGWCLHPGAGLATLGLGLMALGLLGARAQAQAPAPAPPPEIE